MKLSCADFTFPLLTHEKALQLIRLLGLDAVDLGIFEDRSHCYPSEVARNPSAAAQRVIPKLEENGLSVSDVFLQTGAEPAIAAANTPDSAIRDKNREIFIQMLDFTTALGCKHLTGLPGVHHSDMSMDRDWSRACEEAAWRLDAARAVGITYAVEAHIGSILPESKIALRFLEQVPGLTLTLDYGHFIYKGESNEAVHKLLIHASHLHGRGGAKGKLQAPMEHNAIDFAEIKNQLKSRHYEGYLCIEYVWVNWEDCNRTDNISETLLLKELLESV